LVITYEHILLPMIVQMRLEINVHEVSTQCL